MFDFSRKENENPWQYRWRVYKAKERGEIPMDWTEIGAKIDAVLRPDEPQYNESVYRKEAAVVGKFYDNVFAGGESATTTRSEIDELYKARRAVADQRREYNKLLVNEARAENLNERMVEVARQMNERYPLLATERGAWEPSGKEAVLFISDIHYGMVTDNIWNKYNTDIAKQRLSTLASKVSDICFVQKPRKLHVVLLGDLAHGQPHNSCRVAAEEDVVEQLMHVSELIAQMICWMSNFVEEVDVYSTYGNHMRTVQNKKDSVHSDNMERIVPWWLRQRLSDNENVHVIDSPYYEFVKLNVLGWNIVATHGDLDSPKDFGVMANTLFTKVFGETIDYAVIADKHHKEALDKMGIENCVVSSLCGTDEYANNMRLYGEPSQTMMIFNKEDGQECVYNIKVKE